MGSWTREEAIYVPNSYTIGTLDRVIGNSVFDRGKPTNRFLCEHTSTFVPYISIVVARITLPSVNCNKNKKNRILLFLQRDKFPVLFCTVPLVLSRTRDATVRSPMDSSQHHVRWVDLAKTDIPFRQRFSYLLIPYRITDRIGSVSFLDLPETSRKACSIFIYI